MAGQKRVTHAVSWLAGLVLLAGLSACATPAPDLTSGFSARGETTGFTARETSRPELSGYIAEGDGFWVELVFDAAPDGRVEIDTLIDTGAASILLPRLEMAEPWLADGVRRFEGRLDRHGEVALVLTAGPCAIGDLRYGHFAALTIGGRAWQGCARETGPYPLWTHQIGDFLPAMEACRANSAVSALAHVRGAGNRRVVHARHHEGGVVVRFEYPGAGRFDCTASGDRTSWQAVSDTAPTLAGEGDPIFIHGPVPDAGDGCYLYEHVVDADGRLLGALAHDVCLSGGVS